MNIRDRLLELADWEKVSVFGGYPVMQLGDSLLYTKAGLHLDFDLVDREIAQHIEVELPGERRECGYPLGLLVFLSKHRSEMKVDSLTVHTPGNFGEAIFGGRQGTLPPSAPREIGQALRALYRTKKEAGSKDRTTFETTHHGPYLTSPSFFIEIGSYESRWVDTTLGEMVARSLMSWDDGPVSDTGRPICIGIGGGHYAPRFSDMALQGGADFGHMVPDYALASTPDIAGMIGMAVKATPGVQRVHIHRTEKNASLLSTIEHAASDLGLRMI